ncbi:DnaJ-class molecular chaperone [uncultured Alphaproteobacteria bacterium]|uniref:DnaJ-class molecular chaperone n=1 Tax=uncultured Alphaproteobacteria bacterium TaxID=91750 RepID=A0A212KIG9_9PROT|nr:DnaJ-class molecular chaperone [uncultured Alphaproteobacteria bacterium]
MKAFRRSKQYLGDRPEATAPTCAHPGCTRPGVYRAPRDRALREYLWLCLEHVRDYNARWDYYRGLSQAEIEQELRRDTVWQRPTWRLGDGGAAAHVFREGRARVKDPFSVFEEGAERAENRREKPAAPPGSPAYAMEILQLEHPLTRQALKMRYHELVKRHHPDRHGGAKDAEERLKVINEAYAILQRHLDGDARRTAV